MAEQFDAYYEWLGIRPKDQPPTHYRLLGLDLFEDNANVIENAADRQMAHVRNFQTSKHAEHSQRLLNEVAAAKLCLLNPQKKVEYDASLKEAAKKEPASQATRAKNSNAATNATPPSMPAASPARSSPPGTALPKARPLSPKPAPPAAPSLKSGIPATSSPEIAIRGTRKAGGKKAGTNPWPMIAAGVAALIILVGVLYAVLSKSPQPVAKKEGNEKSDAASTDSRASQKTNQQPDSIRPGNQFENPIPDNDRATSTIGEAPKPDPGSKQNEFPDGKPESGNSAVVASTDPATRPTTPIEVKQPASSPGSTDLDKITTIRELGLNLYYPLNDQGDTVRDLSGVNRPGKVIGPAKWSDGAFTFDGKNHIEMTSPFGCTRYIPYTYSLWVRAEPGQSASLISKFDGTKGLDIRLQNGFVDVAIVSDQNPLKAANVRAARPLPTDWTHLAVIYTARGTVDAISIYYNGEKIDTSILSNNLEGDIKNEEPLQLGNRHGGDQPFRGQFDDVRITNGVLTPQQIRALAARRPGKAIVKLSFEENATQFVTWIGETSSQDTSTNNPSSVATTKPTTTEPFAEPSDSPAPKRPVPSAEALAESVKLINDLYKEQRTAAKTPEERATLAGKFIDQARESREDAAGCYALLSEARTLAIAAGNVSVAQDALTDLTENFELEPWKLIESTYVELAPKVKLPNKPELAAAAIERAESAADAGHFDVATKLASLALTSAGSDAELRKQIAERKSNLDLLRKHWDAYKTAEDTLANSADDAAAHLTVGRFLCFGKGDWEKGLPHLAKSGDESLAKLAKLESAGSEQSPLADRIALADDWYAQADKEKRDTLAQSACFGRAAFWYERASADATGLDRAKVSRRLEELAGKVKIAAPAKTSVGGRWLQGPPGIIRTFEHGGTISGFDVDLQAKLLYTASTDSMIRIWDLTTGKVRKTIPFNDNAIALLLTTDRQYFATLGFQVHVFDAKRGVEIGAWRTGGNLQTMIALPSPTQVMWNKRDALHIFDCATLKEVQRREVSPGGASFVAVNIAASPDGARFAGSTSSDVCLWDAKKADDGVIRFRAHGDHVSGLQFSADGRTLMTCGYDRRVRLWNVANQRQIFELTTQGQPGYCAFTPDMKRAIVAERSNIGVYNLNSNGGGVQLPNVGTAWIGRIIPIGNSNALFASAKNAILVRFGNASK